MNEIAIIGAGIAGLSTALALLKQGLSVTVYEQSQRIAEIGAGIQLSSNATQVLQRWGLLEKALEAGFLPEGIRLHHWQSGKTVARFPLNQAQEQNATPYIHIHRADIHEILAYAVSDIDPTCIKVAHKVESIKEDGNIFNVKFTNGRTTKADWVIGADGIHSVIRSSLSPINERDNARFTGNVAWRGLIPTEKLTSPPGPFAHLTMGPNAHLVFYYVKNGRYLNYVAVTERDDWREESWTSKGELYELLQDFKGWHESLTQILAQTDPSSCFRWALHDRDPLANWSHGKSLILGDAAHPMLPFLAQGAAMAIEDAYFLGECFKRFENEKIAQAFFQHRHPRTSRVQLEARKNMGIYHEANPVKRFVRDTGLQLFSHLYPEFMNKRLNWLYNYQPEL